MTQENTTTEKSFEVEKKLQLSTSDSLALIEGFDIVDQIELIDIYWKNEGLYLPLRDRWLRKRDEVWNLKDPLSHESSTKKSSDKYREITNTEDIKQVLGIMGVSGDFRQDLLDFGYVPWITITSFRTVFKSKDFPGIAIVQDLTDFGYQIWEVEKCVATVDEVPSAEQEILDFITSKGIKLQDYVRGKVHEYLYQFKRDEFDELAEAGIMK